MTTIAKAETEELRAPDNATRTSDYPIRDEAREALAAALERVDDLAIALQVRARDAADSGERIELDDFIRAQGYDPAEFAES